MAGYICKIVIEDTHPPVWRRVMIPERITFYELHEVIQILFGWENMHLHEFVIPSDRIRLISKESESHGTFFEEETLIDSFFKKYKWIRYVYDFGDEWRHRINIEKIDEEDQGRNAVLMKVKGDNFLEDSGGIWGMDESGDNRDTFDKDYVEKELKELTFSLHSELEEIAIPQPIKYFGRTPEHMMKKIFRVAKTNGMNDAEISEFIAGLMSGDTRSPMQKKIDDWYDSVTERDQINLKIVSSSVTQKDFLLNLGEKESSDYYRYLRLPPAGLNRVERINAISKTYSEHPEYLLYVLEKDEYDELVKWMKSPSGTIIKNFQDRNMIVKLMTLGLGDYSEKKDIIEISLASDIEKYVGILDSKTLKNVYKELDKLDDRVGKLLQIYCFTDLEGLYEIYMKTYKDNIDRKDFFRFIYWHASFNNLIETGRTPNGMNYVAAPMVDSEAIVDKWEFYGRNLSYKLYSADKINHMTYDLANRSEFVDSFFSILHNRLDMELETAQECLYETVASIVNGDTIDEIMEKLLFTNKDKMTIEICSNMWRTLVQLMLDFELPMLKGRSRWDYACEKDCSPWFIGMVSENVEKIRNTKERHMYQFPTEIQELMDDTLDMDDSSEKLLDYKKKHHICSEEYLYLLIGKWIFAEKDEKIIKKLIEELKKSSPAGKRAAKLRETLQQEFALDKEFIDKLPDDFEVDDDFGIPDDSMMYNDFAIPDDSMMHDDFGTPNTFGTPDNFGTPEIFDPDWLDKAIAKQPYVRQQPKVGRNDPCPCGSGKKYKKCCGRGK